MKKLFLKKNGACVFLSTVFFLSLLAGKFATIEQMLLTELVKKINKTENCTTAHQKKTKVQLNHEVTFAYVKLQISSIF